MRWLPFQRRFLRAARGARVAALSVPRGNGKSTLAANLLLDCLLPGSAGFVPGHESYCVSASVGQSRRSTFGILRRLVEALPTAADYRIAEAVNSCHVIHKPTRARVSVLAANPKSAQGLVAAPVVVADEPGAWETVGGEMMWDALRTAQGKPGSPMRLILIGTLAPAADGWWIDLVRRGDRPGVFVLCLAGDRPTWDRWPTIRRANPLMARHAASRRVLLDERDAARRDPRLRAAFQSFRLNVPSADEAAALLTTEDWDLVCGRPEAPRQGLAVAGIDLGAGRAWSAAVCAWASGRVEAVAVAPGVPSIEEQERRDLVPGGTYQRLVEAGVLSVAHGLRVPPAGALMERVAAWRPGGIVCDRFRLAELQDCGITVPVLPRVSRWSEAAADIRALRRAVRDGGLSCVGPSRALVEASLSAATVLNDDAGNVRLVKRGTNNQCRDDVAMALVLAVGALSRAPAPAAPRFRVA